MASYIDQSLGSGETVIARAQFHWLYVLGAWICLLVPPLAALLLLSPGLGGDEPAVSRGMAAGIVGVFFLIGLALFLRLMIRKWTTEVGVTSHRFVEKYGLFTLRSNEIALPNIEGVRVNQGVFGRIFNFGTVKIEGTGDDAVLTPTIADPIGFVRAIQTAKEHVAGR